MSRPRSGHRLLTSMAVIGTAALTLASAGADGRGLACSRATHGGTRAAADRIELDSPPPHHAHLQLDDGVDGPPPDVGHWRLSPPQRRDLPSDPDHLLVVDALEQTDGLRASPKFAGVYVGKLRTLGVQLSRGHVADAVEAQPTLAISVVVDGTVVANDDFTVLSDSGRPDICHTAHLGMYYLAFTDLDIALAELGIDNAPGVEHVLTFGFAPTGDDGAPLVEAFGIDSQPAPSRLTFNGQPGPGPRHSLARSVR